MHPSMPSPCPPDIRVGGGSYEYGMLVSLGRHGKTESNILKMERGFGVFRGMWKWAGYGCSVPLNGTGSILGKISSS